MYPTRAPARLLIVDVAVAYDPGLGRRRMAAVLFADLTGLTELVDTVDPEIVYQVVRPLMDDLVTIAVRHGGEIQQVLGDGFMCVFGLEETLGDEADRAVRAGLALVAAGGPAVVRPWVHAGVEYGEVFVTPSWPPAGYGVWGRPVNVAQRLCSLAGPGELQVGPGAYARAAASLPTSRSGQARLKGMTAPVTTHRIPVNAAA